MDYTLEGSRMMKRLRLLILGLVITLAASSCGGIATAEPAVPTQVQAVSTPTDRAPAIGRVSTASLPQICDCVLRFDHIGIEDGLSQSSVQVIFQDSQGFLWFGTQDGLNRYDGYTFKIFKPDPDELGSLSDRWIT